jgi:acetylornithine deacetylase/succinyl-diaminopimelate desuccinylase-like protein
MTNLRKLEKLVRELIDFNTENFDDQPGGYTLPCLEHIRTELAGAGIASHIHEYELERLIDGRQENLGKRGILLSAYDPKKPIVLLQGHIDTVPIARRYRKRLSLSKNGIIYGRGSVDMKSSIAAFMSALIMLKNNPSLAYQPVLLVTSDEEAGNFAGLKQFLDFYEKEKPDIRFAVCGEATRFALKTQMLGALYVRIAFHGKSGHAANRRPGDNAIEKTAPFLSALLAYQKILEEEENALGHAVVNVGTIHGGQKVNQIPTDCRIELTIRTTRSNREYEKALAALVRRHGGQMETVFSYEPKSSTDDDLLTLALEQSIRHAKKSNPARVMREFTEATLLNECGIRGVVFGPGDPLLNHTDDENITLEDISTYVDILCTFLQDLTPQRIDKHKKSKL